MARGARPEPWMAISLLVFSMTTLWPVLYLYFDVWVLLACALIAADGVEAGHARRAIRGTFATCAVALTIVLVAVQWRPGASFRLDIGDPRVSGYTGGGFGRDEAVTIDGRSVVWIEGETARVRLPRAGFSGAAIRIAIRPASDSPGTIQTVAAALNGANLGSRRLSDGWQEITFDSRLRQWNLGFNVLELTFAYAAPLPSSGDKRVSAAIDWIAVE